MWKRRYLAVVAALVMSFPAVAQDKVNHIACGKGANGKSTILIGCGTITVAVF
jgi:hypothetical protein